MRQTIDTTWELLKVTVNEVKKSSPELFLNLDAKKTYEKAFRAMHQEIKEKYMKKEVKHLDRHKVAAFIIISVIKSEAVKYAGNIPNNEVFFGQYLIAASVGISYMMNILNGILAEKEKNLIKRLWMPLAISCDTPFIEVFSRNLYFADTNPEWGLNPLAIAEELFILEYVTLEKAGIDPQILKGTTCY